MWTYLEHAFVWGIGRGLAWVVLALLLGWSSRRLRRLFSPLVRLVRRG